MADLRNSTKNTSVKALHSTFWGELLDVDENYAESYLNWCLKQLKENKNNMKHVNLKKQLSKATVEEEGKIKKQIRSVRPKGHPREIKQGDIVLVQFGINLGDEISDLQKDQSMKEEHGHYSVVLAQKGFMFLVVPLSSQKQSYKDSGVEMCIKDLGIGDSNNSYVMFNHIQSVHIRRIKNIQSLLPSGKINLEPAILKELTDKICKFMKIDEIMVEETKISVVNP
ncbi:type II toxin-antitoxin system PemK/MazF family toxin [Lysinibacillus sp. CTST325]